MKIAIFMVLGILFVACQYRDCCPPELTYSVPYPREGEVLQSVTVVEPIDRRKEFEMSSSQKEEEKTTAETEAKTEPETEAENNQETDVNPESVENMASMETSSTELETMEEFEVESDGSEIPGIQTQLHDTVDPVEVGETTDYVLEVWTNGPKDAQNIRIIGIIPAETSFVSARVRGHLTNIQYTIAKNEIVFDTVPSLSPRKKIIYEYKVKIENSADILGSYTIECDDFTKKVLKQEGTTATKRD